MRQDRQGNAARRSGFSIIELVLVLTIIGVLLSVGTPRLVDAYTHRAVRSAADEFTSAYALARATAQRYGRDAQLHVDTASGRFFVDVDTSGTGQRGKVGRARDVSTTGVRITRGDTLLCFDARGLVSSTGLCHSGAATFVFRRMKTGTAADSATLQMTAWGKVLR